MVVDVDVLNDLVIEARSESFIAVLSRRGNLPAGVELDPNGMTATITIMDDDKATFGLDSPRYGVFESDGSVRITIDLLAGALDTPIPVNYRIEPGSARNGDDYTGAMEGTVTFNVGGARSQFIDIPIMNDKVPEAHESFRVVLSDGPQIELATAEALVEILNDDIATIGFEMADYEVDEDIGSGSVNIKIVSNVALATKVTFAVSTEVGSAMASEDYTALDNMNVVLSAGDTNAIVNVSITNDDLIEFDETFEVVLSAPYGLPPGVELDPIQSRVPVKIQSEDTAVAGFLSTVDIDEDENATFNFRLSHAHNLPVGQDVRVYYGVNEAATSATEGEDYTLPETNYVTFSRSNADVPVVIPIINDEISEDDETLGLILLSSDHPDIQYMGGAETITIRDDDSVTVGIIGEIARTVNEGDGSVAVTFGITAGTLADNITASTVSVSYATSADTAFEADDYTPVAGTVILTADNPEVTVWIPITNDAVLEGDEEFEFTITPGGNAIAGDTSADITITDDDPLGTIGFAG